MCAAPWHAYEHDAGCVGGGVEGRAHRAVLAAFVPVGINAGCRTGTEVSVS